MPDPTTFQHLPGLPQLLEQGPAGRRAVPARAGAIQDPRALRGRATSLGAVPERLAPIFRDRSDLVAGDDLGLRIRHRPPRRAP